VKMGSTLRIVRKVREKEGDFLPAGLKIKEEVYLFRLKEGFFKVKKRIIMFQEEIP